MKPNPGQPARILVVDDDPKACTLCQRILIGAGYVTQVAGSAEEGLAVLARTKFDLILLDLRMPGMDGFEFLRVLRRRRDAPAVLLVSGYATAEDSAEVMRLGAADVLMKPFTPASLRERVERLLTANTGDEILGWIREHLAEVHSRNDVVKQFGISPGTVANRVRRATGLAFPTFLQKCRVTAAQQLLASTQLEVKVIAARVGFSSHRDLDRIFRFHTGRSPGQYRVECHNDGPPTSAGI